jgi:protein-S-isoprenylcysteine O-methyltransferase Ste14
MNNDLNIKGHEGRDDLAGEHKYGDAGQMILFFLFFAVWIADSFLFQISNQLSLYINLLIRVIAGGLVVILAIRLFKLSNKAIFKTVREEGRVISDGVYSKVRHPMYLGAILLYLAMILFTLSIFSWIVWIIGIFFYNYIASYEEKILIAKYGEDYIQYMKKVSRWIPL